MTCKWLLTVGGGGMASAIVFLVLWVKALLKELNEEKAGRRADLLEQLRKAEEDED